MHHRLNGNFLRDFSTPKESSEVYAAGGHFCRSLCNSFTAGTGGKNPVYPSKQVDGYGNAVGGRLLFSYAAGFVLCVGTQGIVRTFIGRIIGDFVWQLGNGKIGGDSCLLSAPDILDGGGPAILEKERIYRQNGTSGLSPSVPSGCQCDRACDSGIGQAL